MKNILLYAHIIILVMYIKFIIFIILQQVFFIFIAYFLE
jgi:hypothetical protein